MTVFGSLESIVKEMHLWARQLRDRGPFRVGPFRVGPFRVGPLRVGPFRVGPHLQLCPIVDLEPWIQNSWEC